MPTVKLDIFFIRFLISIYGYIWKNNFVLFFNFHKNETAKAFDLDGKRARLMHLIIKTVKNSLLLL